MKQYLYTPPRLNLHRHPKIAEEKEMKHRRAETLEAIEDIASRRMVSGEKVLDGLAGWGTDSETDAP